MVTRIMLDAKKESTLLKHCRIGNEDNGYFYIRINKIKIVTKIVEEI
jgi:hypothetical protein